jgi:hypothetical protein
MNSPFNKVLIYENTQIIKTPENLIICESPETYNQLLENDKKGLCELIGGENQQIKPIIDIDQYHTDIDIEAFKTDLNVIFPNKAIKCCNRKPRPYNGKMKYSYRVYVQNVRISYLNLKKLLLDINQLNIKYPGIDKGLYIEKRILYTPNTKYKYDQNAKRYYEVPKLNLMDDAELFECCASYIEENFEDWDLKMPPIEIKKSLRDEMKFNDDLCDNTETAYDGKLNFNEIITKLSKDRATTYNDWFYIGVALINLYYRKVITRGQMYDMFDLFSSKADNYDADSVIKAIDTNINRFNGKGYGIKYLLDCLKVDDEEYYKQITKQDMIIDSADDDEGAANLVVKYYKDQLLFCDKILYVYNNHCWNGDEKEVNKLLCNMITNLEIKFLGADNKRKYSYSSSVKHQKNCIIAIRNNANIKINNNFINDLSFNNKYYLPFLNGIYSFKDKKLYKYEELPNIHFTHIINREFMPKDDKAYNELMTRIINPIYPIENEKIFNSQIKARAIAGCVQDKTYYLQTGERNTGKGVETDLMKKAFYKYVQIFDTSSLNYNKFKVNDAKALSWLVEKRFARILIGNEIEKLDEDCSKKMKDTSILINSKLIKQLVSGGDEISARQNYKDEIEFKIGFTLFINSNDVLEFTTKDAGENLITLQYKSKFVKQDELIEGCKYYKLRDDNIKDLVNEDRIINAYIHYIIDAYNDYVPIVPEEIKISTEINNKPTDISVEQYVFKNFKTTNEKNDKLHIDNIREILNDNGFDVGNKITTLFTKLQIGIYDKNITIEKIKKAGFKNIIYTPITE